MGAIYNINIIDKFVYDISLFNNMKQIMYPKLLKFSSE